MHPTHGAQRVADELMLTEIQVSSGGVRGVWIGNGLQTRHHRLLRLEETVRKRKIQLSEEQIQALERFDPEYRKRHIQVNPTGERPQRRPDLGEAGYCIPLFFPRLGSHHRPGLSWAQLRGPPHPSRCSVAALSSQHGSTSPSQP